MHCLCGFKHANNLPSMGLMNGTRLIVDGYQGHLLHAHHYVNGEREDVYIPRVSRVAQDQLPFAWSRRQWPVMLAFAMTGVASLTP
eukprot:COSAG02_NODE_104_length_36421_cov_132.465420_6_plen_86_part_00